MFCTFGAEGALSDLPAVIFKCVCVAALVGVAFVAFDMPMIRAPRLAVTYQPAVTPIIERTAVIGSADISGGMGRLIAPIAPALAAYKKIGAAFGAEGTLPHLPAVFGRPSKRIILGVEIGRAVRTFVAFDPVDGPLLKHDCLRWRIVDTP